MVKPSSSPAPDTDLPDAPLAPTWRRPLLLTMGVLMLGLGVYTNADRLGLEADDRGDIVSELSYASYAAQPDEAEQEPPPRVAATGVQFSQRHKGEEGKMGKPSSKSKSGLYAMKGPQDAVPQMQRNFDPEMSARQSGILGVMDQEGGHYLASPYGGAFAVGNDDEDVWGGLSGSEIGEAYGVGGLGLIGAGRGGGGTGEGTVGFGNQGLIGYGGHPGAQRDRSGERYAAHIQNPFVDASKDAKSTFSIDVDTAAYANVRRYLLEQRTLPPPEAVRTEELINYFDYDYALPREGGAPFSVTTEIAPSVWNEGQRLVHIGLQGQIPALEDTPSRNLVFLLDVSGSMHSPDKLPLVKHGLARLTNTLDASDRVSIVVYAGAAGAVLPPTAGSDRQAILAALDQLSSGGGTNGAQGIELAYELAERSFIEGGVNRVILASDGDFNVGVSDHDELVRLIERKRESGVFLSVLGFGTGNYNDRTMEQLADKGNGNYAYIDGMAEAERVLGDQAGAMLDAIAKDVKIQVEFDPAQVAEHRLVGYENRVLAHRDFDDDTKDAGEIGAGHSVTALYEIVPREGPEAEAAAAERGLMTLNLRYKQPEGERSRKLSAPVHDRGRGLAETSDDYRFSAAVAAFGESLRGVHDELSYAEIFELGAGARGADPQCYRYQFLQLVHQAGTLSGEQMAPLPEACVPDTSPEPTRRRVDGEDRVIREALELHEGELHIHEHGSSRADWMNFALEVLRLLPPFLALPLFIIAARPPRRRRRN